MERCLSHVTKARTFERVLKRSSPETRVVGRPPIWLRSGGYQWCSLNNGEEVFRWRQEANSPQFEVGRYARVEATERNNQANNGSFLRHKLDLLIAGTYSVSDGRFSRREVLLLLAADVIKGEEKVMAGGEFGGEL